MTTEYYTATGGPGNHAPGSSSSVRAELAAIEAGFAKLPTLAGGALRVVRIKADASGLEAVDLSATFLPAAGGTMTGRITFAAAVAEVVRMQNAAPYLSAYEATGVTRTGYLQFLAGANVDLAAENGAAIRMMVGGVVRGTWDTAGNLNLTTGVVAVASNSSAFEQKLASTGGLGGLLVANAANQRVLELYYLGSTQGGAYGATNGDIVYNASSSSNQRHVFSTSDIARTFITATGIGINTAPTVELDIIHSGGSPTIGVRADVGHSATIELVGNGNALGSTSLSILQDPSNVAAILNRANAPVQIGTNGAYRLIIDGAGLFGFNCSPATNVLARFQHPSANDVGVEFFRQSATDIIIQNYNRASSSYGKLLWEASAFDWGIGGIAGKLTLDASSVFKYGGIEVGWRGLPSASVTTGAFTAADAGKCVYATGGVTIPNAVMSATDTVVIQDTTGSGQTITAGATTHKTGGALTGNRTLLPWGRCSIVFLSSTVCTIAGDIT